LLVFLREPLIDIGMFIINSIKKLLGLLSINSSLLPLHLENGTRKMCCIDGDIYDDLRDHLPYPKSCRSIFKFCVFVHIFGTGEAS